MEIITKDNFELKPNTFILVDKPVNWTSFDVVGYLRKKLTEKIRLEKVHPVKSGKASLPMAKFNRVKVGHAGTLDPFATGLLIVALGREATREIENFKNLNKTYEAIFKLGEISDTGDNTGKITPFKLNSFNKLILNIKNWILKIFSSNIQYPISSISPHIPTKSEIEKVLIKFIGRQNQVPPMYSAKKIDGQRLYKLARQGREIKRKANQIEILSLRLLEYAYPLLKVEVVCSPGTYIRTLGEDIGKKLQTGAYCSELKRTKIGEYDLNNAITILSSK